MVRVCVPLFRERDERMVQGGKGTCDPSWASEAWSALIINSGLQCVQMQKEQQGQAWVCLKNSNKCSGTVDNSK